jgi:hypothetical protein
MPNKNIALLSFNLIPLSLSVFQNTRTSPKVLWGGRSRQTDPGPQFIGELPNISVTMGGITTKHTPAIWARSMAIYIGQDKSNFILARIYLFYLKLLSNTQALSQYQVWLYSNMYCSNGFSYS